MAVLPKFPLIEVDPNICGGRPTIAGTRMRVTDLLEMLSQGASETDITADFPYIKNEHIRAALAYAARISDHPVVIAAE
jgi:uncharacterized protein (DUF433 family)